MLLFYAHITLYNFKDWIDQYINNNETMSWIISIWLLTITNIIAKAATVIINGNDRNNNSNMHGHSIAWSVKVMASCK